MSGIFGLLGVNDTERVFLRTIGQDVIYDAVTELVDRYNRDLDAAMGVFVERTTTDYKLRYKLPGGGRLQRLSGLAPSAAVKAYGGYDIALPLEGFGAAISAGRIDYAYMTVRDLDRHLDTVMLQNMNSVRFEMLKALFNNTQRTFVDPLWGSLLVEPLANGDAVLYPPVIGSESEATESHYYGFNYIGANISDTNNPYVTLHDELIEHFGVQTGGENIVVFINNAQVAKTEDLTDFDPVMDRFIIPGADTDRPSGLPARLPGKIVGRTNSCWVVEWRWMPASYMLAMHLDSVAPLLKRADPADTGLPASLALVAKDEDYPIESSYWEHRFGFGCGNRLNGVVGYLVASTSYTIPTGYT